MKNEKENKEERNKRIIKMFVKLRKNNELATNQAICNAIAINERLSLNWVYKLLKKEEII